MLPVYVFRIHETLLEARRDQRQLASLVAALPELINPDSPGRNRTSVLMTVLIVKENILFLEEWIQHHLDLGIDHIVLYDNSKSQKWDTFESPPDGNRFQSNSVNKHGVNYAESIASRISDDRVGTEFERIRKKFAKQLTVIEWARADDEGVIRYYQQAALRDFVLRYRAAYDYAVLIDVDEFLVSDQDHGIRGVIRHMEERGISSGLLYQRRFLHRFVSLDTTVREITWCLKEDLSELNSCGKSVFRLSLFQAFAEDVVIHYVQTLVGNERIPQRIMRVNHYQWPTFRGKESLMELNAEDEAFLRTRFAKDETALRYINQN